MKRVAIITASDTGYKGKREDISGPRIINIIEEFGYQKVYYQILPDEQEMLAEAMRDIADNGNVDLILTTGGTGLSMRDCMPEATKEVIERETPGIPEAMRHFSMKFTKRGMLSRAVAGIRKRTLIVNLPGSPKAVEECLDYILPELDHGLEILLGETDNCGR
jgi:molybdenum cofactor synthesis domain-containing protein